MKVVLVTLCAAFLLSGCGSSDEEKAAAQHERIQKVQERRYAETQKSIHDMLERVRACG